MSLQTFNQGAYEANTWDQDTWGGTPAAATTNEPRRRVMRDNQDTDERRRRPDES